MLRIFALSIATTVIGLIAAFYWGGWAGLYVCAVLVVLEVSLSFDNAVVNASILRDMTRFWQTMFLTVGIVTAVFGMRLVLPLAIVAAASDIGIYAAGELALTDPDRYAALLHESHTQIAMFGGIFLLLVCLTYFLNPDKKVHWLGRFEIMLGRLGRIDAMAIIAALALILVMNAVLPPEHRHPAVIGGLFGAILFAAIRSLDKLFKPDTPDPGAVMARCRLPDGSMPKAVARNGLMGFIYLDILDASFSFDGVIGAFAVTKDVVIIMLGLGIGAMFVRSLTVFLVRRGTLEQFIYLEHGAHYAIGALGAVMIVSTVAEVPEWFTGLIGIAFIAFAVIASIRHRKRFPEAYRHRTGQVSA